jgi:quercetin dioxygenase-like cupin family protein
VEKKKFKYIKQPSWFGEEGPLYEAPEIKEVLRVLFDQQTTGVKQMGIWETSFPPGWELPLYTHPRPVEEFLYVLKGKGIERVGDECTYLHDRPENQRSSNQ